MQEASSKQEHPNPQDLHLQPVPNSVQAYREKVNVEVEPGTNVQTKPVQRLRFEAILRKVTGHK
jgi:hypothetical protein